jgi:hypothetical protein
VNSIIVVCPSVVSIVQTPKLYRKPLMLRDSRRYCRLFHFQVSLLIHKHTSHILSPYVHKTTIFKLDALLASAADSMEEERKALAVERNKTVMARLLAGEITAFEG